MRLGWAREAQHRKFYSRHKNLLQSTKVASEIISREVDPEGDGIEKYFFFSESHLSMKLYIMLLEERYLSFKV